MMSVLVVICIAVAVSTICPLSSATVTDGILEQLSELKAVIGDVVEQYPTLLEENTEQQENALYHKIDAVMKMVEKDSNYMGAIKKLEKDISPKLMEPIDAKQSWLSDDPELQPIVEEFAGMCQEIIEGILIALNGLAND